MKFLGGKTPEQKAARQQAATEKVGVYIKAANTALDAGNEDAAASFIASATDTATDIVFDTVISDQ